MYAYLNPDLIPYVEQAEIADWLAANGASRCIALVPIVIVGHYAFYLPAAIGPQSSLPALLWHFTAPFRVRCVRIRIPRWAVG